MAEFKQQVDNDLFLNEGYLFKECEKPFKTILQWAIKDGNVKVPEI